MYLSEKAGEVDNIDELNRLWSHLHKRYGDTGKHIDMSAVKYCHVSCQKPSKVYRR